MLPMFDTGTISFTNMYLTWKISNFNSLPLSVGCEIRSPEFVYGFSRYTLVIWPRGQKGNEEWFGICLYKYGALGSSDPVQFTITSSLDDIKSCTVECLENNIYRQAKFMEWSDFRALGSKITPNGVLTIICRMSESNVDEQCTNNGNIPEEFDHSMKNQPIKCQSGDYQSLDPVSIASTVKLRNVVSQTSSYQVPEYDSGSPSAANSLYNAPSIENSYESPSDSIETLNSYFKVPYTVTTPESSFLSNFTRGFSRASESNNPDATQDTMGNSPQNSTSDSGNGSAIENINAADNSNLNTVIKDDCVTASSINPSSAYGMLRSSSSSQITHSETENVVGKDSRIENEKVLNEIVSSSVHSCENVVANSYPEINKTSIKESTFHFLVEKEKSTQTSNNANAEKSTQTEEELVLGVKEQEQRNNDICIGNFLQDNRIGVWRLIQDFQNLLQKESVTDVVLKVHGQEFKAHRCVLAARSPVFLAMMSHDTKEKNTGVVDIKDVDVDAIPDFLHYLYTGNVENLSPEKALKLYSVADKYQVVELKQQCMDHLLTNITVDNFCDAITLSLKHNETQLKDACIDFFQEKSLDIVMTTKWQTFLCENPIVGNELFIKHLQLIKSMLQEAGKQIKTRDDNSS